MNMVDETHLNAYRSTLKKAWQHGAPSFQEHRDLETLKQKMNIPDELHEEIETEILDDVTDEYRYRTYKAVLQQAWSDEVISSDEQAIIQRLRKVLNITDEEHRILENQIRNEIHERGEPLPEAAGGTGTSPPQMVKGQAGRVRVRQPVKSPSAPAPPKPQSPPTPTEGDADFWLTQGEQIFTSSNGDTHRIEEAIDHFNKAIEIEPLNYLAWSNKGLGLKILNRFEDALMCYERALTFKPDHINTWFNKAVLLGCMERYEEAADCYRKVLELDPDHELAQRDLDILDQVLGN